MVKVSREGLTGALRLTGQKSDSFSSLIAIHGLNHTAHTLMSSKGLGPPAEIKQKMRTGPLARKSQELGGTVEQSAASREMTMKGRNSGLKVTSWAGPGNQ